MENPKEITISFDDYEKLIERDLILSFLEGAGVDNWESYEEACQAKEEENY